MDYEKAYKEALKEAEKIRKFSSDIAEIKRMEQIFPELKESEDERIMKALIKAISRTHKGNKLFGTDVTREEALAWLEKQGEQKANYTGDIEIPFGAKDSELQEVSYYIPEGFHAEIEGDKVTIKKGEQKPFDYENANIQQKDFAPKEDTPRYSIGDVLCDKSCTTLNKESQSNFEITDIRNGMYICDKCSFPISQQDEYELVAKRIEQKPAWSEDDEDNLNSCIEAIEACYKWDSMVDWLKSLKDRVQPKQEWSEEDDIMIEETLYFLREYQQSNRCKDENGMQNSVTCEYWLKSLKERIES